MQTLEYVTLSSQMFDFLRREIIVSDQFKEGVFIREGEIAQRLGVSRAPVREAIKQMEMMGLVVSLPRRGVQVRFFSPEELNELYEMREVLEGCVFRSIVENGLFTRGQYRRFEEMLEALLRICESDLERDEKIATFCDKDMEFHMSLAELSRRKWTAHALEMLYFQLHQALLSDVEKTEVLADLVRLHYSILDNLLAGDLESLAVDRRYSYFNRRNNSLEI
ncbi:MAG: hypothetical protein CSA35_05280 [Dethiosulfovibrio peptidovorans]|nr:MAG: hypothetical protein CSA35_05280 [Dethiosulfovibrio peptidovorans]